VVPVAPLDAAGRDCCGTLGRGVAPGRGVVEGAALDAGATVDDGAGALAEGAVAAGAAAAGADDVGAAAAGAATDDAEAAAGALGAAGRAAGAAGLAPVDLPGAGAEAADFSAFMRSFNRRTTGGSMVDEAERTNSPMSFSFFSKSLLSSPSSLASS